MKILTITALFCVLALTGNAQTEEQKLESFDRIVTSQFINVVLQKGETESVRFEYYGITPDKVNVKVRNKKLHIYLDDARFTEKQEKYYYNGHKMKVSRYGNNSITAYITYKSLRGIEIRGEKGLTCNDPINADRFKLKVYGENEINIASLQTKRFKASVFGANRIKIGEGIVTHQVYLLFGENTIDTENLKSVTTSSRIYGEGQLTVNANDELKLTAFGDPEIRLAGSATINKSLIFGDPEIKVKR